MAPRKICVVTGSRAEYGLLYWIMKDIEADPALNLQLVVTGMHLSERFGSTAEFIEADGFHIDARVEMNLDSDTPLEITKAIGTATIGFAEVFFRQRPDIVVLLGDRFEILAAATASMMARIPIAHISGGEVTRGAIDDSIRHAITKMASFHFVAVEPYRERVIRMGESPDRVLNLGDPGLDNISRLRLLNREELSSALDWELRKPTFLVTFHPVTLSTVHPAESVRALLFALDRFPEASILFTAPNADAGGQAIAAALDEYAMKHGKRVLVAKSLGQIRYLSAMKNCDVVIGNSSSGIVEAPALKIPSVNVGTRQDGRIFASSIINCDENADAIAEAIRQALSPSFREKVSSTISLYGGAGASGRIVSFLKTADVLTPKSFFDMPVQGKPRHSIGGEFEIDSELLQSRALFPVPSIDKPHRGWFDTGRSSIRAALAIALRHGGRRLAYLPAFCCPSVIKAVEQCGFQIGYYSMGPDLATPSAMPEDLEGATFLYIHYFGALNSPVQEWLNAQRLKQRFFVVEDCVQAPLSSGIGRSGDFAITSLRKIAPQVDGALLASELPIDFPTEPPDETFVSKKFAGKILRSKGGDEEAFLSLFYSSESRLDESTQCRGMSWISEHLMRRTDFQQIATRRCANWKSLDDHLARSGTAPIVKSLLTLRPGEVPLGFPVVVQGGLRDKLRNFLKARRIFCPVHWFIGADAGNAGLKDDFQLSLRVLTLPVDQRLNDESLQSMAEAIAEFVRGESRA